MGPWLRAVARKCIWGIERAKAWTLGTGYYERYWQRRHLSGGSDWDSTDDWVASYWRSREHSHRPYLLARVMDYRPASVVEFGCNCGPNLSLLHRMDPTLRLAGVDINPVAIQEGHELLRLEGDACVKLVLGGIEVLKGFSDESFDVFLTDAVLLYIGPDRINELLSEAIRISRCGLVLLEWHEEASSAHQGSRDTFVRGHWVRDYGKRLTRFVGSERVRLTRLPSGLWPGDYWSRFGHVVEVDLRSGGHGTTRAEAAH